jgi:hypothetical protein
MSLFQVEVFWVVTPCSVLVGYQRFRVPCCLHLQGEVGGSQNQSYFATNSLSVSPSVLALSPSGTRDQILVAVKTVAVLFAMGHPPCQKDGSAL